MKKVDRREFIKLASVAGSGFLMPDPLKVLADAVGQIIGTREKSSAGYFPKPVAGARFGMVIDLGKCIGCRRCAYACKLENNVPDTISPPYIMVFETEAATGATGS